MFFLILHFGLKYFCYVLIAYVSQTYMKNIEIGANRMSKGPKECYCIFIKYKCYPFSPYTCIRWRAMLTTFAICFNIFSKLHLLKHNVNFYRRFLTLKKFSPNVIQLGVYVQILLIYWTYLQRSLFTFHNILTSFSKSTLHNLSPEVFANLLWIRKNRNS